MRKSVRLTDEAYRRLIKCKKGDESYSDAVMRLTDKGETTKIIKEIKTRGMGST